MDIEVLSISDLPEVTPVPFETGFLMVEHGTDTTSKLSLALVKEELLNNTILTGEPTAPTPNANDDSLRIPNTGWVQDKLASLGLNPASSSEYGTVRTNSTDANPVVYLKSEVDALLAPLQTLADSVAAQIDAAIPVGSIIPYPSFTSPSGYLVCAGQAVSRIAYSRLFNLIGTTFGAGNGTTTFTLPNLQGRVIMGAGQSPVSGITRNVGTTLGAETHTLTTNEMPAHAHGLSNIKFNGGGANNLLAGTTGSNSFPATQPTDAAGGGQAHNNIQPSICLFYHIRY